MFRNIIVNFYLCILVLVFNACFICVSAQFFSDEQTGGKVICRFSGDTDEFSKKVLLSGENSIVLDSTDNTVEFLFEGDNLTGKQDSSLSLFATIRGISPELFLSNDFHSALSNEAELAIGKSADDGEEFEITNLIDGSAEKNAVVNIQIKRLKNKKASGNLKVRFPETVAITTVNNMESVEENGKVIVSCKFAGVPVSKI